MISESDVWRALPDHDWSFLKAYLRWVHMRTDAHLGFHVVAALSAMSACVPEYLCIPAGSGVEGLRGLAGGPFWANVFGLLVGPSGDRKTHSISLIRREVDATVPGLITTLPGSKEQLIVDVAASPRTLKIEGEFGNFLKSAKGNTHLSQLKPALTDLYDCHRVEYRTRKHPDGYKAENPRVSFLAAISYQYLEDHTEVADWEGGFLSRFFTIAAERERNYVLEPEESVSTHGLRDDIRQRIADCYRIGVAKQCAPCLGLSQEALDVYVPWAEDLDRMATRNRRTSGQETRTPTYALKIALILSYFDYPWHTTPWLISGETMATACALAGLHTRSLAHIRSELTPNRDLRDRRRVLACIPETARGVPLSRLLQESDVGLYRRVKEILDSLEKEGVVRLEHRDGRHVVVRTLAGGGAPAVAGDEPDPTAHNVVHADFRRP